MWIFYISGRFQDSGNDINLRVTDKREYLKKMF